jgi:hypothetical protein
VAGAVCRSRSARSGTSLVLLLAMPGACACPCFVGDCRWGCSQLFAQLATAAAATCMRGDGRAPSAPSSTAAAATRPQHHGMHATAIMGSKACVHAPTCADATPALLGASSPACRPVCQRPAAGPGLRGVEVTMQALHVDASTVVCVQHTVAAVERNTCQVSCGVLLHAPSLANPQANAGTRALLATHSSAAPHAATGWQQRTLHLQRRPHRRGTAPRRCPAGDCSRRVRAHCGSAGAAPALAVSTRPAAPGPPRPRSPPQHAPAPACHCWPAAESNGPASWLDSRC